MSDFSGEGFRPFPNIYYDLMRTGDYAMENPDGTYIWTTERLEAVVREYEEFLMRQERVMPRAADSTERIIGRAAFELSWREGIYDDVTNKGEDESCLSA